MAIDVARIEELDRSIPARTPGGARPHGPGLRDPARLLGALLRPLPVDDLDLAQDAARDDGVRSAAEQPEPGAYREVLTEFDFLRYAANSFFLAGRSRSPTSSSARSAATPSHA